ncbi:hypothetical protein M9H77_23785 [Catharanthus roseus]|uniref:Uncharacterized protein n=1 Tax=Catharanthus roseus TaxID=4058 RepID=A0ACC0AVJ8_CATRO|nr:hypothetical protein M9H77_23785 [Catharanthus roseus]
MRDLPILRKKSKRIFVFVTSSGSLDYKTRRILERCFLMKKTKNKSKQGKKERKWRKQSYQHQGKRPTADSKPTYRTQQNRTADSRAQPTGHGFPRFSRENSFMFIEEELGENFSKKHPLNSSSIR